MPSFVSYNHVGDGAFREQVYAFDDPEDWLSIEAAAHLLGLKRSEVRRHLGALLVYYRPLRDVHLVHRQSALALRDAMASNPRFWSDQAGQAAVRAAVANEMRKRVEQAKKVIFGMPSGHQWSPVVTCGHHW
jgi:hypothetical protein